MPTLRELQAGVRAALLEAERPHGDDVASHVHDDGLSATARLAVYRHHVLSTLTAALETTFPVVCRLVDRRFFAYAADRYIRAYPPLTPCLFEYGATFADFLADFPPCRDLGYLADVARLEWAMNVALHASDVPALDLRARTLALQTIARVPLRLEPSITLLASPWPLDHLWRANQPEADPEAVVDLDAGGARLEVRRRGDDVVIRTLAPADFAFRDALARAGTLQDAAEAALAVDAAFDLVGAVGALIEERAIVMPPVRSER